MARVKKTPYSENKYQYQIFCPGCNANHAFDDRWHFNDDYDKPTIAPSLLVSGYLGKDSKGRRMFGTCHSFIREGKIQFLNDCTHELRGQTVELPEYKQEV